MVTNYVRKVSTSSKKNLYQIRMKSKTFNSQLFRINKLITKTKYLFLKTRFNFDHFRFEQTFCSRVLHRSEASIQTSSLTNQNKKVTFEKKNRKQLMLQRYSFFQRMLIKIHFFLLASHFSFNCYNC